MLERVNVAGIVHSAHRQLYFCGRTNDSHCSRTSTLLHLIRRELLEVVVLYINLQTMSCALHGRRDRDPGSIQPARRHLLRPTKLEVGPTTRAT